MKIRELSIKNCLSFGDKGLGGNEPAKFADFNLFIGANNSGKSNVLKLIEIVRRVLRSVGESSNQSLEDFPLHLEEDGQYFKDWVFGQVPNTIIDFSFSLEIEEVDQRTLNIPPYKHDEDRNPVSFLFGRREGWPKCIQVTGDIKCKEYYPYVSITRVEIPNDQSPYREKPILFDRGSKEVLALTKKFPDEEVWDIAGPHLNESQWRRDYPPIGGATLSFLTQLHKSMVEGLFVRIGAVRAIRKVGDEIVESLTRLRDGTPEEVKLYDSVIAYIRRLIFGDERRELRFLYPGETKNRQIRIQIGELQLPLAHYGSAVEQMLVLAVEIVRYGTNKVILIEEPEAHFYPRLQREFVRFLRDNQQVFGHQYLVATHSSVFVDEFINMRGNVFHVYLEKDEQTGTKYSQVEPLGKDNALGLFRELGMRPSDLLLANGVLIVEGPTDTDVYKDWARKMGKGFESIGIEVIDVEGAGNIKKYLISDVIRRSCFGCYGLCDRNAEAEIREKLQDLVPDENILALKRGDLEDYYPRELVLEFAREWGEHKNKPKEEIPNEIAQGKTVSILNKLLGRDWWKRILAEKVIREMQPEQIDTEVRETLTELYEKLS